MILFDKSSQDSFDQCEQYYKEAKDHACPNLVFMLLGNKTDLESVVSSEQGLEAAHKFGALYSEISVKDNRNIDLIFEVFATHIAKKS